MAKQELLNSAHKLLYKALVIAVLSYSSFDIYGQTLADFSGIWIQDITKSDDFYKNFDVKCAITQTTDSIIIKTTFSDKNGAEIVTRESTFSLDGKVKISEEGRAKKSATWSADRKTLTTSDIKDYGGDPVGVKASYTLSDDGHSLSIKTSDINPAVKPLSQVFNKKK